MIEAKGRDDGVVFGRCDRFSQFGRPPFFDTQRILKLTSPFMRGDDVKQLQSRLKEKGYDPLAFRFMVLGSHYRKQLVFSFEALEQAQNTLNKLRNRINNISEEGELDSGKFDLYNNNFRVIYNWERIVFLTVCLT